MISRGFFTHVARVTSVTPASSVEKSQPNESTSLIEAPDRGAINISECAGRAGDEPSRTVLTQSSGRGWESPGAMYNEKTPLLHASLSQDATLVQDGAHISIPKRVAGAVVGTVRLVVSTVLAPGRWIVACFYDENGRFSALLPVYRFGHTLTRKQKRRKAQAGPQDANIGYPKRSFRTQKSQQVPAATVPASSDANVDERLDEIPEKRFHSSHTRSFSTSSTGSEESESSRPKRSIRISTLNEETLRHRKQRREQQRDASDTDASTNNPQPALTVDSIKSPINPVSSARLTRYPPTPAPPRPLIPKRQPSYVQDTSLNNEQQKTLVIDLDETLIHSMAKGGRMSTGHMVEVKLSTPVGAGGTVLGPQVPILYYVHKRPHCDSFLQKVSKWYKLIVFTASVQEYADPVIDHLEQEKRYFSARYYRQHCTYRNGVYIKDLSLVEPDLSKVMILDNSPMSYILHEDNAIPIEGWISDPTDNDLLHLVPLLEGLQWTTDVRALLALRLGESHA